MSPVSRRRRARKRSGSTPRRAMVGPSAGLSGGRSACECPCCSGAELDPRQLVEELVSDAGLAELDDPLDAEIAAAQLVSIGEVLGEAFEDALVDGFIPEFEAVASAGALAMLLAIGSVTDGRPAKAASVAADRLAAAGVPSPAWAAELRRPVTVTDCHRITDRQGTGSLLACSFHRAGRSHTVLMTVDHLDCGAAIKIVLLDSDQLPTVLGQVRAGASGVELVHETLDPADFRWQFESALDARAVHDGDRLRSGADDGPADDDDDQVGYPALAALLRTRLRILPVPGRPKARHGDGYDRSLPSALGMLAHLARTGPARTGPASTGPASTGPVALGVQAPATQAPAGSRARSAAALPAKRTKSDGPAPVYQLKVSLRGAKPPIWRRLEVHADTSLARLHEVIQLAFDWYDDHLHVFETPYGEFGAAHPELGHRAEARVTLEQVAPDASSKIRYTYDFGDDWEHDIVVEKVLDRDAAVTYPRCTGGRRAAPPEDCGGLWGYAELEQILADPDHPDHEDRLEWLGLTDPDDFDPDDFDPAELTEALAGMR